jgi:hypothetical protein
MIVLNNTTGSRKTFNAPCLPDTHLTGMKASQFWNANRQSKRQNPEGLAYGVITLSFDRPCCPAKAIYSPPASIQVSIRLPVPILKGSSTLEEKG